MVVRRWSSCNVVMIVVAVVAASGGVVGVVVEW